MAKDANKTLAHRFSVLKNDFKDSEKRKIRLKIIGQSLIHLFWVLFRTFIIVGMAFVLIYPILYMVSMSFRTITDMYDPSVVWIPRHFTMENIQGSIKALKYWESLWNTITLDVVSSIIQVFVCAVIGYGFARFKFKGKGIMFGLVILTIIVPTQTILISLYGIYRNFSVFGILDVYNWIGGMINPNFQPVYLTLLNNYLAFYLPALFGMGIRSGLYIFIYRQFFRGLPKELEEAAWIDGCGKLKTFWRVMLPNATAVFVTVFLFSLVWYWNDYFNSSMFINSVPTISTMLAGLRSSGLADVIGQVTDPLQTSTYVQAGALLSIAPMLILYMIFQRQFTESIERSGIVG